MATAALQSPPPPTTPASDKAKLLAASAVGAAFILAGVGLAGYGVPTLFRGVNLGNGFITAFVRVILQLAAIGGLAFLGGQIAGANPPKGLRGGIFLIIMGVLIWTGELYRLNIEIQNWMSESGLDFWSSV